MLKKQTHELQSQSMVLADKLRRARKDAKLTMQFVADEAGLSVGFISQVERGIAAPSLGSLVSIAKVLQTPVGFFLENTGESQEMTRQSERQSFEVEEGSISYERLSANFPNSVLNSVIINEPPNHRIEPISHDGEEIFYILEGEISVEIEGVCRVLKCGDSLHFDSRRVHAMWNHSDRMAVVIWCGTMDIFGEGETGPSHRI